MKKLLDIFLISSLLFTDINVWVKAIEINSNYVNCAIGKPVTASSYLNDSYRPENVFDGDKYSMWSSDYTTSGVLRPDWVQVDLLEAKKIKKIELVTCWSSDVAEHRRNFKILVSNDEKFEEGNFFVAGEVADVDIIGFRGSITIELAGEVPYRFVRYFKTNDKSACISELRVLVESEVFNVAYLKTATASSVYQNNKNYAPSKANDETDYRWASAYGGKQWWQVDLGAYYYVKFFEIKPDTRATGDISNKNFEIRGSNNPESWEDSTVLARQLEDAFDSTKSWQSDCMSAKAFRYIRLTTDTGGTQIFTLNELRVFSEIAPEITPEIVATAPQNNQTDVKISDAENINIYFNTYMDINTLNPKFITLMLETNEIFYSDFSATKNSYTLKPPKLNFGETYTVTVSFNVLNYKGIPMETEYQFSFTITDSYQIYVSNTGDDTSDGSEHTPFATLERAKKEVRNLKKTQDNICVNLYGGRYELVETMEFSTEDGGGENGNIIWRAVEGETPVISGGKLITNWMPHEGNIWKTNIDFTDTIRSITVDGRMRDMCSSEGWVSMLDWYDNPDYTESTQDGIIVSADAVPVFKTPSNVELRWVRGWRNLITLVTDVFSNNDGTNTLVFKQPQFKTIQNSTTALPFVPGNRFRTYNAYELLDEPGEFYYDSDSGILYYLPHENENMHSAEVVVPMIEKILNIRGSGLDNKVKNLKFEGIIFSDTDWNRVSEDGFCVQQGQVLSIQNSSLSEWPAPGTRLVPAGIQINAAENISFTGNTFRSLGGVGIGLYDGVSNCNIQGNVLYDIADSAITVGLPTHNYISEPTNNIARDKFAWAGGIWSENFSASKAIDGNFSSLWASSVSKKSVAWWAVDLGKPYDISSVQISSRIGDVSEEIRRNFDIIGSNNPDFSDGVVLASQGAEAFPYETGFSKNITDRTKYRYIKISKKVDEFFALPEVTITSTDLPALPVEEVCKNNNIQNNYIENVGMIFGSAPGIQGYYTDGLTIKNNELRNLPYSGIALGWGWNNFTDSTTCKDNRIVGNIIEKFNLRLADGGAVYTLGNQPGTVIEGNYIADGRTFSSAIYPDEGSRYLKIQKNVIQDVAWQLFVHNDTILDIIYSDNFYGSAPILNDGLNIDIQNNTFYIPGAMPVEAQKIVANVGISKEWRYIKPKIELVDTSNLEESIVLEETYTATHMKRIVFDASIIQASYMIDNFPYDLSIDPYPQQQIEGLISARNSALAVYNSASSTMTEVTQQVKLIKEKCDALVDAVVPLYSLQHYSIDNGQINVSVRKNKASHLDANLIAAEISESNQMLQIEIKRIPSDYLCSQWNVITIPLTKIDRKSNIKVFLWEGIDNIIPYLPSYEFTNNWLS